VKKRLAGTPQSSVLIPVPDAEPLVERWRMAHDPSAPAGVPAHITLLVPWIPPERLGDDDLAALEQLFADVAPFDFALTKVGWFGDKVLWLSPAPATPFVDLTRRVAERFGTPPWGGEFSEVVPHLTVGLVDGARTVRTAVARATRSPDGSRNLRRAADTLSARLPVACRAQEVWVMVGEGPRWEVRHRLALAPGVAADPVTEGS
jgi:2'-5' RNA ligase